MENDVKKKIRFFRKEKNLTQRALGMKIGVSQQQIQSWEKKDGRTPSLSNLQKLADALGVPLSAFLTDDYGALNDISKLADSICDSAVTVIHCSNLGLITVDDSIIAIFEDIMEKSGTIMKLCVDVSKMIGNDSNSQYNVGDVVKHRYSMAYGDDNGEQD